MLEKIDYKGDPLPEHFVEAERFYVELRKDPEWLRAHMGKYLAIMGQEIVGEANNFHDLSINARETHGYGPIFMQLVTEVYPREVRLRSRLKPPISSNMG